MDGFSVSYLTVLAGFGIFGGLSLLAQGFVGFRTVVRVADTSTSPIGSLAAGEVRITGVIEAGELTLVSLLQSVPSVYYRSHIGAEDEGGSTGPGYTEERSIGFRVRDATGTMRVFPRDARFDAPVRFAGKTDMGGDEPAGLNLRREGSTQPSDRDRADDVAALLTVHHGSRMVGIVSTLDLGGRRSYREARLEPGDPVTIVGRALPFSDLDDPADADTWTGPVVLADDPEVAADLAEARADGALTDDPAKAWGNAAIEGFGIGRPVTEPVLDPGAHPLPLAGPGEAVRASRVFDIAPETLVLAAAGEVSLLVALGTPGAVVGRGQARFVYGLLGAIVAIASAMVFAVSLGGFGG